MKKKIILILALGILIRLILAFSTFHSDIQPFYFAGSVIAKGNVLNFYDYLRYLSPTDSILKIYPTYLFNYPPLVYFFLGPISYFFSLPFSKILLHNFIFNLPTILGNIQLNFLLLAFKLPYLAFDLGIAALLYKFFDNPKSRFLALCLWMFNPINLFATYMMGQFDVIPTFFSVWALYIIVKKNRYFWAAFLLGIGASLKIFPFLFLIPLALIRDKWTDRIKVLSIGVLTYFATILPFLGSHGFRSTALVAGQTTKSLYAAIPISGGESIILFPLFILFIYLIFYFRKNDLKSIWSRFFILLLLFFVFTHYHPQWFIWITPFLIIDLVKSKLSHWPLVVLSLISWLGLVTFFDPGLSTRLFAPIVPSLQNAPGIWESLKFNLDLNGSRSILQTLFAAVGAYYIYYHFPRGTKV